MKPGLVLVSSLFVGLVCAFAVGCGMDPEDLSDEDAVSQAGRVLDPNAIKNLTCTAPRVELDGHSINVALLSICGGIAGPIQKCQGKPTSSTGAFGDARFNIKPVRPGATINVSKGRWEAGVFAARARCGDSPFQGVIPLGTSNGDLRVDLVQN